MQDMVIDGTLDDDFACAPYIEGSAEYIPRWARLAAAFRAGRPPEEIAYGSSEREVLDLWQPKGTCHGTLVFVHGGYWHLFHRSDWSHLAQGALDRGWAVAMPGYDLAPNVRIAQITQQIVAALGVIADRQDGPVRLAGHSAGGHLVSRMLDPALSAPWRDRVDRVMPISPVTDLVPLLRTSMNQHFQMDKVEAQAESPVLQAPPDVLVHIWVGEKERPVFLQQAEQLAHAWGCQRTIEAEKHHFDVIEGLQHPDSEMMQALLD